MTKDELSHAALLALLATIFTLFASSGSQAQCLNPTTTPGTPITQAQHTQNVLCNIANPQACGGGVCSPDYIYAEWETFTCVGGLLWGQTWTDGEHGWAFACIAAGGVPVPERHSCSGFNVAHCEQIRCSGPGTCPSAEFCSGDGICKSSEVCSSTAQCGEYVCNAGLCMPAADPRPDLTVLNLRVVPPDIRAGGGFIILADIRNLGETAAGPFRSTLGVEGEPGVAERSSDGLAPGQSQPVFVLRSVDDAGDHQAVVEVDVRGEVDEADEGNNAAATTFPVSEPPPRPDLRPIELQVLPPVIHSGESFVVLVTVRNQGNAPAAPSVATIRIGGETEPERQLIRELEPGESSAVVRLGSLGRVASYQTTVRVDVDHEIEESSEANNHAMLVFEIQR